MASLSADGSGKILLLFTDVQALTDLGDKMLVIKTGGYLNFKGDLILSILN